MKLAFELGYPSVDRMLAMMTSRDVSEWMAYFRVEAEDGEKRQREARVTSRLEARARAKGIPT